MISVKLLIYSTYPVHGYLGNYYMWKMPIGL